MRQIPLFKFKPDIWITINNKHDFKECLKILKMLNINRKEYDTKTGRLRKGPGRYYSNIRSIIVHFYIGIDGCATYCLSKSKLRENISLEAFKTQQNINFL